MRCYPRYIPWLPLIWIWIIFWFLSLVNNFCRKAILFIGKGSSFIGDSKHRVEIELLWSSHSFSNESSKLSAVRQKSQKCLGEAFFCVVALFQCQKAWVTFIFCSFCANVRTYTTYTTPSHLKGGYVAYLRTYSSSFVIIDMNQIVIVYMYSSSINLRNW